MGNSSTIYPEMDQFDFEFEHAEPFNRFFGKAIINRKYGVDEAKRVAGLRRESQRNRRIEIWEIEKPACLIRLRHLGNSFYFEINYPDLEEEIENLVSSEDWRVDYVEGKKMTATVPDRHLPSEGFVRSPDTW